MAMEPETLCLPTLEKVPVLLGSFRSRGGAARVPDGAVGLKPKFPEQPRAAAPARDFLQRQPSFDQTPTPQGYDHSCWPPTPSPSSANPRACGSISGGSNQGSGIGGSPLLPHHLNFGGDQWGPTAPACQEVVVPVGGVAPQRPLPPPPAAGAYLPAELELQPPPPAPVNFFSNFAVLENPQSSSQQNQQQHALPMAPQHQPQHHIQHLQDVLPLQQHQHQHGLPLTPQHQTQQHLQQLQDLLPLQQHLQQLQDSLLLQQQQQQQHDLQSLNQSLQLPQQHQMPQHQSLQQDQVGMLQPSLPATGSVPCYHQHQQQQQQQQQQPQQLGGGGCYPPLTGFAGTLFAPGSYPIDAAASGTMPAMPGSLGGGGLGGCCGCGGCGADATAGAWTSPLVDTAENGVARGGSRLQGQHSFSAASARAQEFRPGFLGGADQNQQLQQQQQGPAPFLLEAAIPLPPVQALSRDAAAGPRHAQVSQGSLLHDGTGRCSPCAWFWKPKGCSSGAACTYCHSCPEGELKTRKKAKVAVLRSQGVAARSSRTGGS